jgi:hypothetical protein
MPEGSKPIRAQVGDVVRIPISTDEYVHGQVLDIWNRLYLVAVFRAVTSSPHDAMASGIDLAAYVFDALIRNGGWPIVASLPRAPFQSPWFLTHLGELGTVLLATMDDTSERIVSVAESQSYDNKWFEYAMVLQMAAEAAHGHREWMPEFDRHRQLASQLESSHPG